MEIIYKSKEEVEDVALRALRDSKNKSLLNNKNVDCSFMVLVELLTISSQTIQQNNFLTSV